MSLSFRIPIVGGDTSIADIKKAWDETGDAAVALDDALPPFYDELRRAGAALEGKRIVILIDDLDPCTAENMVLVLKSINVITDVPGFVFVLALDYDVPGEGRRAALSQRERAPVHREDRPAALQDPSGRHGKWTRPRGDRPRVRPDVASS